MEQNQLMSLSRRVRQFYGDMHERITIQDGDIDVCYSQYLSLYEEARQTLGYEPPVVAPSAVVEIRPIEMAQQLTLLSGQLLVLLEFESGQLETA